VNIWDIIKILFWIAIISGTVFYFTKSVKRLFQVAGGLALLGTYNNLYDYGLWPIVQNMFGSRGVVGLTIGAIILNFVMLKWYQKSKIDWLGITVTDEIVQKSFEVWCKYEASVGLKKLFIALPTLILWIMEKAITIRFVSFLILSIFQDSFVATAFFLHRKNGKVNVVLKKEDYAVFIISTIIGCSAWTLFSAVITIPAFKNVWQIFTG
jgi:hypothetical protein